jgi:6-phosphofructokinase 1
MKNKIGILTAGGDCPGLNAVIRAVAKTAFHYGWEVIGFEDGFDGVVMNRHRELKNSDVSGILTNGGTILGTSNVANPFRFPVRKGKNIVFCDYSAQAINNIRALGLKALVCVGGDGTLTMSEKLFRRGVPIVGVPKTIDNDLSCTDLTFGFQTAVHIATEAIDRLHTTGASHHRVMILEVMGRYAGWIALHAGLAGGSDVILVPEIPYSLDIVCEKVKARAQHGKRFSLITVGEGARPKGGKMFVSRMVKSSTDPIRLGGIGHMLGRQIEDETGIETRVSVLGHIQRGGSPIPIDRNLGTSFGVNAVEFIRKGKFGYMTALDGKKIVAVPIRNAIGKLKLITKDNPLLLAARAVGTSFGD